jgi:hypothetical protein
MHQQKQKPMTSSRNWKTQSQHTDMSTANVVPSQHGTYPRKFRGNDILIRVSLGHEIWVQRQDGLYFDLEKKKHISVQGKATPSMSNDEMEALSWKRS